MTAIVPAHDREEMFTLSNGQNWAVSWHPPNSSPTGKPHGTAGLCVTHDGGLVLISHDGQHWGFPAGRPEPDESPMQTLCREMREEACVVVTGARLLGFSRSECTHGHEQGLVLVRSYWQADVDVQRWDPQFEILHRRIVPLRTVTDIVRDPDEAATRISFRALTEAGLI